MKFKFEDVSVDAGSLYQPGAGPAARELYTRGYTVLRDFIPADVLAAYRRFRDPLPMHSALNEVAYLYYREVRDLCLMPALQEVLADIIGEPAGLHLNLSNYFSTERDWHQDCYLSPASVGQRYVEAWFALEDIDPNSGPFEVIPYSHTWGRQLAMELLLQHYPVGLANDPDWPKITERDVVAASLEWASRRGGYVESPLLKRGDVLLWGPLVLHRGSPPKVPGTPRRALIAHYSGIHARADMRFVVDKPTGGWLAHFATPTRPNMPDGTVAASDTVHP